jgi:adenine-specific DNA-methyltransferase
MAARRRRSNRKPKSVSKEILDYRHKDVKRKNNPEEGLATYLPEEHETKRYEYDPHLDPQLVWTGKAERISFGVPVLPLHIHERITPRAIASLLKRRGERQTRLFDEQDYPLDKRIDFYKHEIDWANRLVLGDSLVVLNSLLTKELMSGKAQMIYVDPPYAIKYPSNFQPTITDRQVKDKEDKSLTREPEQIKAYRDAWELGTHSWLGYLRDRLLLSWELLSDAGSLFLQINDENLNYAKSLAEEIFGRENFCAIIAFRKTGGLQSSLLASVVDYLIWFAKDKKQMKFHKMFFEKRPGEIGATQYRYILDRNGKMKELSRAELSDVDPRKVFTHDNLTSQGNPIIEFKFNGRTFKDSFKSNPEGLRRLAEAGRLIVVGNTLRYMRYLADSPFTEINEFWHDTGISGFEEKKQYVVQTSPDVIERCILMTTDPGDLVIDPTCGGGTTAYAAERWGRRWITCDTSRVALAIARQRLLTSNYPYYSLSHPEEGIKSGFIYETTPHVKMEHFTQNEPTSHEILYDRPRIDHSVVRISGPYTVEGIPPPTEDPIIGDTARATRHGASSDYLATLIETLRTTGIILQDGKRLRLDSLVASSSPGFIHAEGASAADGSRVAVSFGPRYGSLGVRQAEEAIRTSTANGFATLILAGFHIDLGAQAFVERTTLKLKVQFVNINPDMEIHDLLRPHQSSQLFTAFGEPDVEVEKSAGEFSVSLKGVDVYDPMTGETEHNEGSSLPAWFLDEDYDGYSFNICQVFFPDGATRTDPWDKLENALRGSIDRNRMDQFRGTKSLPFETGPHATAAVKVIDARGNEMIRIVKLKAK